LHTYSVKDTLGRQTAVSHSLLSFEEKNGGQLYGS
jgi:hypothetical protein